MNRQELEDFAIGFDELGFEPTTLMPIEEMEEEIKRYQNMFKDLLKDLEDYERIKELMGTPFQEIIKKKLKMLSILKPLIEIYPNYTTDADSFYDIRIKPLHIIDDEILLIIKEWLENDK